MRHILFGQADIYPIAILLKYSSFNEQQIRNTYVDYLVNSGIKEEKISAYTLKYDNKGKAPVKLIREYLDDLLETVDSMGTKYLYVADAAYFKALTKKTRLDPCYGYLFDCVHPGYEHLKIILGVNYQALIFNPALVDKLNMGLQALVDTKADNYIELGSDIIHSAYYPDNEEDIKCALKQLHSYSEISADIETFSLKFNKAGIATIAFAWDEHNGLAFSCDYIVLPATGGFGMSYSNYPIRKLIKEFLETYKGTITWHNANYDLKVLVYTLWMSSYQDYKGMLKGIDTLTKNVDDTKIIAYLALNSTADISLGLKPLAHEFAGNWANDGIKDITEIPLKELLEYNLIDALCTNYVKKKYTPIMIADNQEEIYKSLMLPSMKLILQMELCGMPMSTMKITHAKQELESIQTTELSNIRSSSLIKTLDLLLQTKAMEDTNSKLKVKQHPLSSFNWIEFNPSSPKQVQALLYDLMKLPVIDYTKTKQPAVGEKTLSKLLNHTTNAYHIALINSIINYKRVTKILTTFIPAFMDGIVKQDGRIYLHGSFNIGGTVSGRLSSSDPNLQNIPSNTVDAYLIKEAFVAPEGWLMLGADYNSLEDMVSALTTKDPNKLKVYTDGYDGHSFRAYAYFKNQMPDIENTVDSINSIETNYPHLRQHSKEPTFLLTYRGTYHGLMNSLGIPEAEAKVIETNYHQLYKVSDQYIENRLIQAAKDGYTDVAFGLRVRTPLIAQTVYNGPKMPYEAKAEARTAANAMGQSYGLLNNRSAVDFMEKVWKSPYRYDILPISLIHDAVYLVVKDDIHVVKWVNEELIKSMQWQELPELQHDEVKLGATLNIYWPSWNDPIKIPNSASLEEIRNICDKVKNTQLVQNLYL